MKASGLFNFPESAGKRRPRTGLSQPLLLAQKVSRGGAAPGKMNFGATGI